MSQLLFLLITVFLIFCYGSDRNERKWLKSFPLDSSIYDKDESFNGFDLVDKSSLIPHVSRKLQSSNLVGSYNAYAGPSVGAVTYTCQQACASIFGGVETSYYGSILSTTVTRTCYTRTYGPCDQAATSTDTYYNCATFSTPGCVSAYLNDGCGVATNYCFTAATQTRSPTFKPTMSPSIKSTFPPSRNPSFSPTYSPTCSPSLLPTFSPSCNPTFTPSYSPTCYPTFLPTYSPSCNPTFTPTFTPSYNPTMTPSFLPTYSPSYNPTMTPSFTPTCSPSYNPTFIPTFTPSYAPTFPPSFAPTFNPSFIPSCYPTHTPSCVPSFTPTATPSCMPTVVPSAAPTRIPSFIPSYVPTPKPSYLPSFTPSVLPTSRPSNCPSVTPTKQPSAQPLSRPSVQPTSHPSGKPSFDPSKQPTSQPIGRPSVQPSHQPSRQPWSHPSMMPTDHPSKQPTSQPIVCPTLQPFEVPSSNPSAQPSHQPITIPTMNPSQKPSSSPTANPSSQPIGHPTLLPSNNPTTMPSSNPSHQPLSRPTIAPSLNPTSFPSTQPFNKPSMRPSTHPSVTPTSIPTSIPSYQPISKPSFYPVSQPSKQPIANPSERPTAQPTYSPNNNPTTNPSSQPSHFPSHQEILYPTTNPSNKPSDRPSNQPSGQPSAQPQVHSTSKPTSQPSSTPSAQPISHPTKMPVTSRPSVAVKGVRMMPTSHPSLSMDSLWTNQLAVLLSVASANTGNSVAHKSTYFELDNLNSPTNKHGSSSSSWSSFNNDLKISSFVYNPSAIQLTVQSDLSVDAVTDYSSLTVSCRDLTNITKIINYMTGMSNTNIPLGVECDGYTWVARYCSSTTTAAINKLSAVCIGCVDPCSASARCLNGQRHTEFTLAPGMNKSCGMSLSSQSPIIRLVSVHFSDIQSAPAIRQLSSSASKYSITITASLSSQGLLYCAAYNRWSTGPQTVVELVLKNFMAKTNRLNATTVTIAGLNAVTIYTVYCLTESLLGTRLSLDKVRQSAVNITTSCCNTITVTTAASSVTTGQSNANFLSLLLNSSPSESLSISVIAVSKSGVVVSSFAPSTFSLSSNSIVGPNSPLKAQLLSLAPDYYSIQVSLSGNSRDEYEVIYYNNASRFDVLEKNAALPAPKIVSAVFADTGNYFTVKFDSATNKAAMKSNSFVCSVLFQFACSDSSTCQWVDSATVNVFVYSKMMQNCSIPGSYLDFSSSVSVSTSVKAKCSSSICPNYDTWPVASLRSPLKISSPISPVTPLVTISSPSAIGNCDSLTIDVSTSTGGGGRDWRNKTITVQNDGKANVTVISAFLKQLVFVVSPPTVIPARLFSSGQTYYFIVTLCNFLSKCGQSKHRVTALANPVPTVSIPGPVMRSVSRGSPLTIKSYASVQSCDSAAASQSGLDFAWSVYKNNVPLLNLVSRSVNPTVLTIPAFSLFVGQLYEVRLTVTMSSSLQSSTASVQVLVQSGSLVPRIAGSAVRNIRFGDSLLLDGSLSLDEDTNSAAGLVFLWSCVQLSPEFTGNCSKLFQSQSIGSLSSLSLVAKKLPYLLVSNSSFTAKVTMSIYGSDRSAQSSVTVNLVSPVTPMLINVNSNMPQGTMNGADKLVLSGMVTLPFGSTGTCGWLVDDISFSLQKSSLSPLTFPLHSSGPSLAPVAVYMSLAANSVPTGSSLTFSLTCEVSSSSSRDTASISIVVNAPPQPGNFQVVPNTGVELSQKFTFVAENWQSVNLPISYQFGYVSTSNLDIVLRSLSEMTYAMFALPAGDPLQCMAQIYDSVSANATAVFAVSVTRSEVNASFIHRYLSVGLLSSADSFNVDTIKQIASLASGTMNLADCSLFLTPNCSRLNRQGCLRTSHTCSSCYSGYIGDDGDSNEPCVLQSSSCSVDADCLLSGSSEVCIGGVCQSFLSEQKEQKACLGNCSNHGSCRFVNVDSGVATNECLVTDNTCLAVCDCNPDYFGSDYCDVEISEMSVKQMSRSLVIKSISSLTRMEDVNLNSLTSWINSLSEALRHPAEISVSEVDSLLDLVNIYLEFADSVVLPFVTVASLLTAVDSIATTISNNIEKPSNITKLTYVLHKYTKLVTREMVAGQSAIQSVNNQFRMKSVVLSSSGSNNNNSDNSTSLLSLPLTSYEIHTNRLPSSVFLTVTTQQGGINSLPATASVISLKSKLYNSSGTTPLISNPITLHTSNNLPCLLQSSPNCEVVVVLQNSQRLSFSPNNNNSSMETLVLKCRKGLQNNVNRTCSTGHTVNMTCDGKRSGVLRYNCPVKRFVPSCVSVSGTNTGYSDCRLVSFTNNNVTCSCKVKAASTNHRLLNSYQNSTDFSQPSEYQFDYMSLLETTESSFVSTFESTVDLSVESIAKGWKVLVTVGSFVFGLISAMVFAYFADKRDVEKKVSVRPDQSVRNRESAIVSVINKSSKVLTELTSTSNNMRKRRSNSMKEKKTEINNQLLSIEEYFPMVLSSQSLSAKVSNEVRHHHRWFSVIFHYSEHFSRLFRVISLATSVIIMLFMQSLTYNLTNPDDGSCKQMTTRDSCITAMSPYATGEPKCQWTVDHDQSNGSNIGSCSFIQPDSSIKIVLFVAIFSAIISTPIAILSDVIMQNIISAPVSSFEEKKELSDNVRAKWLRAFSGTKGKINASVLKSEVAAKSEMDSLLNDLRIYREELTESERNEFDMVWGLDSDGQFITERNKKSISQYIFEIVGIKNDAVNIYQSVLDDLKKVRASVDLEVEKSVYLTDSEKGRTLMHLFQCDLLPGVSGKILETKGKRDQSKASSYVSPWVKFLGWGFILSLNSAMLFYIFLFAMNQTSTRQEAWFRSFVVWLVLDVSFISTASVVFTHIVVPSMIMKDVTKIKQRMMENISSFQTGLQQILKNNPKNLERRELVLDLLKEKAQQFNAASYLFVSSRVAVKYLYLREAQLIFNFVTPWPRQSYQHADDVSSKYDMKLSALNRSVSIIVFFFINGLMTAPISIQDIIIQIGSTGALGYGILVHIDLFNISRLLALLPLFVCCMIAHFFYYVFKDAKRRRLAKLTPVTTTSNSLVSKIHDETTKMQLTTSSHVGRRQSLLQGISVIQKLRQEHNNNNNNNGVSSEESNCSLDLSSYSGINFSEESYRDISGSDRVIDILVSGSNNSRSYVQSSNVSNSYNSHSSRSNVNDDCSQSQYQQNDITDSASLENYSNNNMIQYYINENSYDSNEDYVDNAESSESYID